MTWRRSVLPPLCYRESDTPMKTDVFKRLRARILWAKLDRDDATIAELYLLLS